MNYFNLNILRNTMSIHIKRKTRDGTSIIETLAVETQNDNGIR